MKAPLFWSGAFSLTKGFSESVIITEQTGRKLYVIKP